ncbi:MAG: ribonuclease HII [Herpetosiphonaceae bacterium]|nr:ribonuclease HII [Herpetosiphonaceae bacterium]
MSKHPPVTAPTSIEQGLLAQGYRLIAGIDEVGRGCWAGPVVAAAVIFDRGVLNDPRVLEGVTDSKLLTAQQRRTLAPGIMALAIAWAVGSVPAWLVDQLGIVGATRLAMEQAVLSLNCMPDVLLLDALTLPTLPQPQVALIKGDRASLSIAAASIIAKTARDRYMLTFDRHYPHRFGQHKGYGTALHQLALAEHGLTPLHRRSFRPLWAMSTGASYGAND